MLKPFGAGAKPGRATLTEKTMTDEDYMRLALAQARAAERAGEVPIGALLLLADGRWVPGHNQTIGDHDPSGHAEIIALRRAGRLLGNHRLLGATVYTTLEPCLMCLGALLQARIRRLVFGAWDRRFGACGGQLDLARSAQQNFQIQELRGGVLETEALALLQNFFRQRRAKA